jgi:phage I-like protein
MEKFLAAIRRGLGLKDEADEAEVQGAVMALAALTAKAAALEAELGAVKALAATPPGELATLQAKTTELEGKVATLSAEIDKRDREHVLERARWEGKVVSLAAEVVEKMSVAELAEHVAKIESTVPLAARTPGAVQEPRDGQITEADRSIARACGLDPAKMAAK